MLYVFQQQESSSASGPSASDEEYELQHDPLLLRFLTECAKIKDQVEKMLTSISCSAQLQIEEGSVLVRHLVQPGAAGQLSDWKSEVDKIFEVAKYRLQDGLEVLVCEGDITKQYADALVNAANKYLDHGGGVAAALSKAGGPQVQKECKDIIKTKGKLTVSEVVVTTGGNLKCKKLLHAVGPKAEKDGGKERLLLEHTVKNVLDLAESMNLSSIAMPCISSGRFGVPIAVCSEAIVNAVREFGSQDGRSLRKIILIDVKGDVVKAMQSRLTLKCFTYSHYDNVADTKDSC
uniref:Macro domain-containing protein n=1 Tax=Oryzias melastigma TaxID=30732 RepID=A0A3B3CFL6_ORYME